MKDTISNKNNDKKLNLKRRQVVLADLGIHLNDSVQGGIRPVLITSNNMCNKHSQVITVVPLSTRIFSKKNLPTHVFVSAAENKGIERNSLILSEQVTILPITKIINPNYGEVNEEIMEQVTKALQIQLGMVESFN